MGLGIGQAIQIGLIGAAILGVVVFVWMAFRNARKRGERKIQLDQASKSAKRAQQAAEIDDEVSRLSDDDLDGELRG